MLPSPLDSLLKWQLKRFVLFLTLTVSQTSCVLYLSSHLILIIALSGKCYYCSHFTGIETEGPNIELLALGYTATGREPWLRNSSILQSLQSSYSQPPSSTDQHFLSQLQSHVWWLRNIPSYKMSSTACPFTSSPIQGTPEGIGSSGHHEQKLHGQGQHNS